jgi:hypothetical protein
MNLKEIEQRVAAVGAAGEPEFLFELLRAYGLPAASVTRLRNGSYNKARSENEVLWRDKVFYRYVDGGDDIHALIDAARSDEAIAKQRPRFLIVRNSEQIVAVDTRTSDTLDTRLSDLPAYSAFFLPWAGIEKTQIENLNLADIKAAEKMAKLYDEIVKRNAVETEDQIHDLNVFFSRLLFCFFAEDTGVFEKGSFTNAIGSFSLKGGEDVHELLDEIFDVLNTKLGERIGFPSHLQSFGYVNGKLFERHSNAPTFSAKARSIVLECGSLDWSQINPDIFGSMMQAVVHPGQRESLGMHYTSVENIMKVIRPLFLDDLQSALEVADTKAKLTRLHDRIAAINCFDPACGSGNFLVIAYKELRKLEHRILKRLQKIDPRAPLALFQDSRIKLENFYGIEIDDFAHEVAILSLWLAKHQMNVEFKEWFGADIRLIPLRDTGNVVAANATRVDWHSVCPAGKGDEIYLFGNPPYQGAKLQRPDKKLDFEAYFGTPRYSRNLDYISLWFLKGAEFVRKVGGALGFVSTNSICQGDHVALLWPLVLTDGVKISFAHQSFQWSNRAKGKAGVTCVIVGLSADLSRQCRLYSSSGVQTVSHINAYLRPSARDTIVYGLTSPLSSQMPDIGQGSRPNDGGHLVVSPSERDALIQAEPSLAKFFKRYMGTKEFLNGVERYCLWIPDGSAAEVAAAPGMEERFNRVREARLDSGQSAQSVADFPFRFDFRVHRDGTAIIVPSVSSEKREYIPVGFLDGGTVISNLAYAIYGAEPWVFALISSRMHTAWVRAIAGGLDSRIRYSAKLCYNSFPVPSLSTGSKTLLSERAFGVLQAREAYPERAIADLYAPEKMPGELREAHQFLDAAVDHFYRKRPFRSDDERLELLFDMYEAATSGNAELATESQTANA